MLLGGPGLQDLSSPRLGVSDQALKTLRVQVSGLTAVSGLPVEQTDFFGCMDPVLKDIRDLGLLYEFAAANKAISATLSCPYRSDPIQTDCCKKRRAICERP